MMYSLSCGTKMHGRKVWMVNSGSESRFIFDPIHVGFGMNITLYYMSLVEFVIP